MQECPFCSTPIDPNAATSSAEAFGRINQACSDASYLEIMCGVALTFFLIAFLPIFGMIGSWGLLFLELAIPVMAIRWWVKFSSIKSDDPEFIRARRTAMFVAIGAALVDVLLVIRALVI